MSRVDQGCLAVSRARRLLVQGVPLDPRHHPVGECLRGLCFPSAARLPIGR